MCFDLMKSSQNSRRSRIVIAVVAAILVGSGARSSWPVSRAICLPAATKKAGLVVFHRFEIVGLGDSVSVARADGTVAVFMVDLAESFPKYGFPGLEVYGNPNYAPLRLVVCGCDLICGYLVVSSCSRRRSRAIPPDMTVHVSDVRNPVLTGVRIVRLVVSVSCAAPNCSSAQ